MVRLFISHVASASTISIESPISLSKGRVIVTIDEVVSTRYFLLLETVKSLDTAINFGSTEVISYTDTDGNLQTLTAIKESEQYNAVHHYEDTNGVQQDITLFDFGNPSTSLLPVTYRDRLETRNEELKEIIVLRPDAVVQVVSEFNKLMRQ